MIDDIIARLVDKVENRYYGKYRGTVADNQDPENIGRIKALVPRLLEDQQTGWALPCVPYGGASEQGFFAVPEPGAAVWIEFEGGDLAFPIWTGTWWGSGEVPEAATPDQKVLKTRAGHTIILDDADGAETIEIADASGNSVKLDSDGITVTNGSMSIKLTSSSVTVNDGSLEIT